jgi:hypothetical protein
MFEKRLIGESLTTPSTFNSELNLKNYDQVQAIFAMKIPARAH